MLQAARHLEPATRPDDWVPIELAAELTGDSVRQWRRRATFENASAEKTGRFALAEKRPSRSVKGRRLSWYVHRGMHALLRAVPTKDVRDDRARASLLTKYAEHSVTLAYKRADYLHRWQGGCRRMHSRSCSAVELAETIVREARQTEDDGFAISVRTLQRWAELYNAIGPDGQIRGVEALIDGRSPANRPVSEDETEVYAAQRSPEAVECFYLLYHTESRTPIVVCHEHVVREAEKHGWSWPSSYSATRRWLQRYDRTDVTYMNRYGLSAFTKKFMPYNDIDYSLIQPADLFTTDHHECDWWCQGDGGKQFRPWLTVVQDARSRTVVGWHLGASPHTDAIVAAYLMAFRDWAIPSVLRIDNGKDFTSERLNGVTKATRNRLRREHGRDWQRVIRRDENLVKCTDPRFSGITNELGIRTVYAIPYAAWSKGQTERLFGTLESRLGKTFATYCGNSTLARPECLEVIRNGYTKAQKKTLRKRYGREWKRVAVLRLCDTSDVPTLDVARKAVGEWVTEYHQRKHSAEDMAGKTPLEMWNTATSLRRADAEALLFLMQSQGVYRVGPNGVRFKVGATTMKYGAGNPCLYRYTGRDVFITIDPNDVSACYAFTPGRKDRRFIGKLDSNVRVSPLATTDELREANANVNRRRKLMRSADGNSPNRTRTAAQELAAQRRDRVAELRATGTDGPGHTPNIVPVETGFEKAAKDAKAAATRPARTDRPRHSREDIAQALGYGHREPVSDPARPKPTLDMLVNTQTVSPEDDGDGNHGKEAESTADILSLIGDRHGRTKE